jgi:hypothetical protein
MNSDQQKYQELLKKYNDLIRPLKDEPLQWSELRGIRNEICDCLLAGFNQAAIALTNHFFERTMKLALIYHESGSPKFDTADVFSAKYKPAIDKYDESNLSKNIDACLGYGLIDDKKAARLHVLRRRFRNGFSHAEAKKILGEGTITLHSFSFTDSSKHDINEEQAYTTLFIQGVLQEDWAKQNAPLYFYNILKTLLELQKKIPFPEA